MGIGIKNTARKNHRRGIIRREKMKHLLLPDYDFPTYREITPDFLKSLGIKGVLCDIDNTLIPYDEPHPTPEVIAWVNELRQNGIAIAFLSNNDESRIGLFNRNIKALAYHKSGKPMKKTAIAATKALGINIKETAVIGDQLLTDVLTARFAGMTAIWVPTIKKVETPFFRVKGMIEKPFIKKYYKRKEKTNTKTER